MNLSRNMYVRITLTILGLLTIFLFLIWGRSFYGAMQCYQKGIAHLEAGELIKAVTYFDRSLHWYTPFSPYVRISAEKLWKISEDAERRGDHKLALIAARTIRRGFYSARSFYTPGKAWIEKCDERIEKLWAIQNGGQGTEASEKDGSSLKTGSQDQESRAPNPFWSGMLLLGLFGWIGSVIVFILRGFRSSADGCFVLKSNMKWLGLGAIFFFIWIVGMMKA